MKVRWVLRLYPRAWRDRYEDEVQALLDQRGASALTLVDLLIGALDAAGIVLEHNGHTVRNLDTPLIGRDIMTYLFDKEMALKSLAEVEPTWGGDYQTRRAEQSRAFQATQQVPAPAAPEDTEAAATNVSDAAAAATTNAVDTDAADTGSVDTGE